MRMNRSRGILTKMLALVVLVAGCTVTWDEYGNVTSITPTVVTTTTNNMNRVVVPGVIGQTLENAEAIIANSGLNVTNIMHRVSNRPAGTVVSQIPLGGHSIKAGGNMTLTVAVTGNMVNVPIVTGRSQTSATLKLKAAGLELGSISRVPNAAAKRITVMRQNPRAGSRVASGSKVNLTLRVPTSTVTVPNVVGKSYLAARMVLQKNGYKVIRKYVTSSEKRNQVISQSPIAGSAIANGASVTLVLSRGGTSAKVPSVMGKNVVLAKSLITQAGFKVKVTEVPGMGTSNVVISQSPTANMPLKRGGTVKLKVRTSTAKHPRESVIVPNIVGQKALTIRPKLSVAGLQTGRTTYAPGRAGYIISQNPRAGMNALRGSKVDIVVGKAGTNNINLGGIPNLSGTTLRAANVLLTRSGYVLGNVTTAPGAEGKVLRQSLRAGTKAARGTKVDIVIGKAGTSNNNSNAGAVSVPSLVGKTYSDATKILHRAGLKIMGISYKPGLPGRILSHNPKAGTKIAKGGSVSVVVGRQSTNADSDRVSVPNVIGKTSYLAGRTISQRGLKLQGITYKVGTVGKVLSQNPVAGKRVVKGSSVSIVVGKAADNNNTNSISVPNVIGQSYGLAATTLRRAGLKIMGISYEVGTVNKVIRQNPAAGTKLAKGGSVAIVIGKKAPADDEQAQISVPNVVGTPVGSAIAKLKQLGLVQGRISYVKGPANRKGKVFTQSPAAGTKVAKGTKVNMTIGR